MIPSDEQLSNYLAGDYGPPSPEAVDILHDWLEDAVRVNAGPKGE